jgi:hypothetical protein
MLVRPELRPWLSLYTRYISGNYILYFIFYFVIQFYVLRLGLCYTMVTTYLRALYAVQLYYYILLSIIWGCSVFSFSFDF